MGSSRFKTGLRHLFKKRRNERRKERKNMSSLIHLVFVAGA